MSGGKPVHNDGQHDKEGLQRRDAIAIQLDSGSGKNEYFISDNFNEIKSSSLRPSETVDEL